VTYTYKVPNKISLRKTLHLKIIMGKSKNEMGNCPFASPWLRPVVSYLKLEFKFQINTSNFKLLFSDLNFSNFKLQITVLVPLHPQFGIMPTVYTCTPSPSN